MKHALPILSTLLTLSLGLAGFANAGWNVFGLVGGQGLSSGGSTVLILAPLPGDRIELCTGVIIAADTAITAGHCLAQTPSANQITLHFTHDRDHKGYPTRKVRSGLSHENFRLGDSTTPDLAILNFEGGLPPGYFPVSLATDVLEVKAGDFLYLAGYGWTEINSRIPTGQIGILHGGYFGVADPLAPYDEVSFKVDRNHSTATGDSGGPAYWVSPERVALFGISKNARYYEKDWRWVDRANYTRVAPYRKWIDDTMASLRNKPVGQ